jgi:hypothetical protein
MNGERLIEEFIEADLGDVSADQQPSPPWSDAERDTVVKLAEGDSAAFLARAREDPGFPFEPAAISALLRFAKDRRADWQRLRAQLKAEPKIHLSALEAVMKAESANGDSGDSGDDGVAGRPVRFEEIEPWPEPVDGAQLMADLSKAIGSYVIMSAHQRDATALWTMFTHAHDLRDYAPLLAVTAPTKRCGKTRLQETLARLVPRPQMMSGITAALLPRLVEKHRPTLFIDEYDAQAAGDKEMAESLRGQLNSSFNKSSAGVLRLVPLPGGGWDERRFSTWAPTSVAGIGMVPDTVKDRSVIIRLLRKPGGEKVRRLRGCDGGDLLLLARKAARFVNDNEPALRNAEPASPDALNDRQADAWDPLFAIAEVAGGEWPERARAAAKALCQVDAEEDVEADIKTVLLADVRDIFARLPKDAAAHEAGRVGRPDVGPRIFTKQLLNELIGLEERPWGAWGRAKKPLTDSGLAALLRPYGIRSGTIREEGAAITGKGYYLRSFNDVFSRYLPIPPFQPSRAVTNAGNVEENGVFADGTYSDCDVSKNARNASNSGVCAVVTAKRPENRGLEGRGVGRKRGLKRPRTRHVARVGFRSMTVVNALELARSYGVRFLRKPDGGIRYQAAAAPPPDVVAILAGAKADFLRVLAGREAARAALDATAPPDCLPRRWTEAQLGLQRFVAGGWGDQASLLGWSPEELYRVPALWARVDLTGAALLVADRRVVLVTESSIAIETPSGSRLKFRRIGREHLA